MTALGESFRTARESQGLTLADVADRTHIRSVYLAAIEAEDWQSIGPAVYIRGFLRTYARFLGLDPDAVLARFSGNGTAGSKGSVAPAGTAVTLAPSPRGEPSRSGLPRGEGAKRGPSIWAVLGVIVAVVLVGFVGYQYYVYEQPGGPGQSGAPLARTRAADAGPRSPVGPRARANADAPENRPPVANGPKSSALAVRLKDSSWLRVIVDGKVVMEGLFAAGTARSFPGRSAVVRVGNAGGVDVTVDGKDLGPMGGLGDVAERSFRL